MSQDDPYVYDGTDVLRNRFDIRDADALADREQLISSRALLDMQQSPVNGRFDFDHYLDTHRRLYEPLYEFAGRQNRTAALIQPEPALGGLGIPYSLPASIEADARYGLKELQSRTWTDLTDPRQAGLLASGIAELWRAHPFRQGNTRTLLVFVDQFTRHHDLKLDQTIINRDASRTHAALAQATTGSVGRLAELITTARRSEQRRHHPQLGRVTSEELDAMRRIGNPRIVQPEIGAEIRGRALATSHHRVLVHDDRHVVPVPLNSFRDVPANDAQVSVIVRDTSDRRPHHDSAALDQNIARDQATMRDRAPQPTVSAGAVLIPAALVIAAERALSSERRPDLDIPAPSEALAKALATQSPRDIARQPNLMDEARAIQDALHQRFGPAESALLAHGDRQEVREFLPPGQDLDALRSIIQPLRATVLADMELAQEPVRQQAAVQAQPTTREPPARETASAPDRAPQPTFAPATLLIPADLTIRTRHSASFEIRPDLAIPAPSEALAKALATQRPHEIARQPNLMDEARDIQDALHQRFGHPEAALLTHGDRQEARDLLPPGQDLDSLRSVLQPLRAAVLADMEMAIERTHQQSLSNDGPSRGRS